MELVALLSENKEGWGQVTGLVNHGEWDNIVIIGHSSARNAISKKHDFIEIKGDNIVTIKQNLVDKLKPLIKGTEVGLSIASGDGKEHMAIISALLSVPVGIRFSVLTKEGIVFM
jgi:hypothetical protein